MRARASTLPVGRVTLLFSDIEGSTRLLEALGDGYGVLLADHHRLLREEWSAHGGVEINNDGDAFFVAFAEAQDAVNAAVDAQRRLELHAWPEGTRVRVRMGLHSGEPRVDVEGRDYWGLDVHYAARIASAAHGGQILASAATAAVVSGALEDLGDWSLKDFDAPAHLFQVVVDGRGADTFPPPRALDVRRTNLPEPPTPLVGREAELAELRRLLSGGANRLVTIIGLGGVGKTRLALEAGHALREHFTDGVFFVDLSGLDDPAMIPTAVATAVGIRDRADMSVSDALGVHVRCRRLLLIVDNCEHVLSGVKAIASWLAAAPEVRVLATSQTPLRLRAEHCLRLDSLTLPSADAVDPVALAAVPSVRLFVERAAAADPGFALTHQNARDIVAICERLEGLPMALELAAARARLLTPQHLARLLREDFSVLATKVRDATDRHSSLQSALDWTVGLLEPDQRTVFTRWGLFAGRPTLEQAELVCGAGIDVLAGIEALLDLSLLRRDADGRLRMPQAVHAYARKALAASGELDELRVVHAAVMADVADAQHVGFWLDTATTLEQAAADRDDFYAALDWARERRPALHARLAGSMILPLLPAGIPIAFEPEVEAALRVERGPTRARVRLLIARGVIAYARGRRAQERAAFEEAIAVVAGLDDELEHALTLMAFAKALTSGAQSGDAHRLLDAAAAVARRIGDGVTQHIVDALRIEAYIAEGRYEEGAPLYRALLADTDARHFAAFGAPHYAPDFAIARGDYGAALEDLEALLRLDHAAGRVTDTAWQMQSMGCCLVALGQPGRGLTLIAAGEAQGSRLGMEGRPADLTRMIEDRLAAARRALGDSGVEEALVRGRRMPWDAAIGLALRASTSAADAVVASKRRPRFRA